jgi:hypothetical protein
MGQDLKGSVAILVLLLLAACGGSAPTAGPGATSAVPAVQALALETLKGSAAPGNRINLVVLGDGYRLQDQDKLTRDARAWLTTFLNTAPFGAYSEYFNVRLVHLISKEDGAENGMYGLGVARDTALHASFQNANPPGQAPDYRLLVVDNALAQATALAQAPEATRVLVLVNDTQYGGSGGAVSVFSAHANSASIALHEFGHSFGGLADEYACGDTSRLPDTLEAFPNVTACSTLEQIKWQPWLEPGIPLPTPATLAHLGHLGLFTGAYYHDAGVYRPREACRMRSLGDAFCEVCSEAIVRQIYAQVSPLDGATPASPVQVAAGAGLELAITRPVPVPDTFQVAWSVDGVPMPGQGDRLSLPAAALTPGVHTVRVQVQDATPLVRLGQARLAREHVWTVTAGSSNQAAAAVVQEAPQHQVLRVVPEGNGFRVVERRVVDVALPPEANGGHPRWQVEVRDAEGELTYQGGIEDPTLLRGEFQHPAESKGIQQVRTAPGSGSFLLRLPMGPVPHLDVFRLHGGQRTPLGQVALNPAPQP